jgi:hypothetical protein
VLYTSRDPAVLKGVGTDVERIDVLPVAAARELLARLTQMQALPAEADRILEATGRVALAVALVGAAIGKGGLPWQQVVEQLDRGHDAFLDHPYANTFKAMQVAITGLDATDAKAYRNLAVYPEDTLIPVAAVRRLWSHLYDSAPKQTDARLETLAASRLLTLERDGIRFHDLQREFLLLHTDDLSLLHADLLAAYHALLPEKSDAWSGLPQDESYIWEHLLYHLRGAGDGTAITTLICDLAYLALRSFRNGPYATESDLRQAAALYPDHPTAGWLLRLFTQWGHLFASQPTVGDLSATLASRTRDAPTPINVDGLAALLPPVFLAVQRGLPNAPLALTRVLEGHTGWVRGGGVLARRPPARQRQRRPHGAALGPHHRPPASPPTPSTATPTR